jgi:hypothetical protein
MYGHLYFLGNLIFTFSYLYTLLYNLVWEPQRDFVLLNNIDFGETGLNLTDIVPNIQTNRVIIVESHFPYMKEITDTYEPIYGGIPQYVNYTDFTETIQHSIEYNNLTTSYDGFIVFDTEEWTPIWETIPQIYQNMTINYTLNLYPELKNNDELLKSRSREIWNQKSMDLLLKGIGIARNKCPFSKIGYYGYPGMPYWGNNADFKIASNHNDELFSLWNNVDVLLPSIYIPYISTYYYEVFINNYDYVERKIKESIRIKNIMNRPDVNILPYTWHRYHDPYDKHFLVKGDVYLEYKLPYNFEEIDGLILWSSENNEQRMEDTKSWFENNTKFLESLT